MRENASKTKRYRIWKRAKAKETIEPKKRILNVFWFHFVFLSFYFCFSKVSHQPNRQERLNLPTALNVQRINVGGKPKIQGRSSLRHYTTRSVLFHLHMHTYDSILLRLFVRWFTFFPSIHLFYLFQFEFSVFAFCFRLW